MLTLSVIAQSVIAASVLFVWIFRFENIEKEFSEYRMSIMFRSFIGAAKIALSTLLIVGIWYPSLVLVPALSMAVLMAGAQWSHLRVRHAFSKFVPSLVLLLLSLFVAGIHAGIVGQVSLRTVLTLVSSLAFIFYGTYCLTSPAMEREFLRYGLANLRVITGWLELLGGIGLIFGLWWPPGFLFSSGGLSLLMLCGLFTRLRIGDPFHLWLPALLLMLLNGYLLVDALRNRG